MPTPVNNKYRLKSLHEEIDLFDRKLAHMLKYETFPTEAARKSTTNRMQAKRDLLAQTARQLANEGVEFKSSELPRSFRDTDQILVKPAHDTPAAEAATSSPEPLEASPLVSRPAVSHFAGTVLDGQAYVVEAYKRSRSKPTS